MSQSKSPGECFAQFLVIPQRQDDIDARAATAPPAREAPKRFPPTIERALALLAGSDHGALSALSMGERLLLARYVRCADARDPCGPIRVSIRALADGLKISARTVNTLKAALLASGWITSHQVQSRRHGMQICDVRLTARTVHALQLLQSLRRVDAAPDLGQCGYAPARLTPSSETPQTSMELLRDTWDAGEPGPATTLGSDAGAASAPGAQDDSTERLAAGVVPLVHEGEPDAPRDATPPTCGQLRQSPEPLALPLARACANAALACRDSKEQPLQRHPAKKGLDLRQPSAMPCQALPAWRLHRSPQLPRPLTWLERHMSATRVCLLMREAREHGVELETVATAARDRIDRAREPFAYLRALVKRDPTSRSAPPAMPEHSAGARHHVGRWSAQAQGLAFASTAGLVHRVEGGVVRVYTPDEATKPLGHSVGVLPLTQQFIFDVGRGHLRPWSADMLVPQGVAAEQGH